MSPVPVTSDNSPVHTVAHEGLSLTHKVNESAFNVGVDELNSDAIAHVETLKATLDPAIGRRSKEPQPSALL